MNNAHQQYINMQAEIFGNQGQGFLTTAHAQKEMVAKQLSDLIISLSLTNPGLVDVVIRNLAMACNQRQQVQPMPYGLNPLSPTQTEWPPQGWPVSDARAEMMSGYLGQGFNTNVDPNMFNQNVQSMLEQESPEYGDGMRQSEIYAHANHESNDSVVISFNWFRLRKHAANTNYFARIAQSFTGIATVAYDNGASIAPVDIYESLVRHIAAPNCAGMRNMALVIRRDEFSELDHALARNLDGICIGESKGSTMYRDSKLSHIVHGVSRLDVSLEAFGKIAGDRASNSAANEALLVIGNLLGRPIAHNGFWVFSFADPRPGLDEEIKRGIEAIGYAKLTEMVEYVRIAPFTK